MIGKLLGVPNQNSRGQSLEEGLPSVLDALAPLQFLLLTLQIYFQRSNPCLEFCGPCALRITVTFDDFSVLLPLNRSSSLCFKRRAQRCNLGFNPNSSRFALSLSDQPAYECCGCRQDQSTENYPAAHTHFGLR